jgi:hypothetical protein
MQSAPWLPSHRSCCALLNCPPAFNGFDSEVALLANQLAAALCAIADGAEPSATLKVAADSAQVDLQQRRRQQQQQQQQEQPPPPPQQQQQQQRQQLGPSGVGGSFDSLPGTLETLGVPPEGLPAGFPAGLPFLPMPLGTLPDPQQQQQPEPQLGMPLQLPLPGLPGLPGLPALSMLPSQPFEGLQLPLMDPAALAAAAAAAAAVVAGGAGDPPQGLPSWPLFQAGSMDPGQQEPHGAGQANGAGPSAGGAPSGAPADAAAAAGRTKSLKIRIRGLGPRSNG